MLGTLGLISDGLIVGGPGHNLGGLFGFMLFMFWIVGVGIMMLRWKPGVRDTERALPERAVHV